MKDCISKIISWVINLWRTVCSTFVRKHIYKQDVDHDSVDEYVIDINGNNENKEENNNDKQSN